MTSHPVYFSAQVESSNDSLKVEPPAPQVMSMNSGPKVWHSRSMRFFKLNRASSVLGGKNSRERKGERPSSRHFSIASMIFIKYDVGMPLGVTGL